MPAGNHGSCIPYLGLDICFDEVNYHDSLQACVIEGNGHLEFKEQYSVGLEKSLFFGRLGLGISSGITETIEGEPSFRRCSSSRKVSH